MILTSSYRMVRSGISGSKEISDAQLQYEEAKRLLLGDESELVTSAKREPISLSRRRIIKEAEDFKILLQERQAQLAEMKRSGADPIAIKKQLALIKKTQNKLNFFSATHRPKDWHTIEGLTRAANAFLEKMGGDDEYVDWYERHRDYIGELFKDDREWGGGPDTFYTILASLSPRNKVSRNMSMALEAYKNYRIAMLAGDEGFTFTKETAPGGVMKSHLKNLNRMLKGEALGGNKVPPFDKNLRGDVDEVTIDMWMGIILFGHTAPSKREIDYAKKVVRKIAANMGKTPRFVQGLLWEMVMKHWGRLDSDFQLAVEQAVRNYANTGSYFTPRKEKKKIAPAASRRISLFFDDDSGEVADTVLVLLGKALNSENPRDGEIQENPLQ